MKKTDENFDVPEEELLPPPPISVSKNKNKNVVPEKSNSAGTQQESAFSSNVVSKNSPKKHSGIFQNRNVFGEKFWVKISRKVGGEGLVASILFHAILICFAIFWITRTWIESEVEEVPSSFVTGSGGGNGGERPSFAEKSGRRKPIFDSSRERKILSKSASAKIALPENSFDVPDFQSNTLGNLGSGDGLGSSGFCGGAGGGIGSGKGIGVGNGRNLVSKFEPKKVMGATIYAEKIAVYLDNSPSMEPFLPRVREEIYDKYPDADFFEFNAILTTIVDGEVLGGRSGKVEKHPKGKSYMGIGKGSTDHKKLSRQGAAILQKFSQNFEAGSVGAWLDVMIQEKYDALVVFSDFQDGIRQYNKNKELIFADSMYYPTTKDGRKDRDMKWFKRWLSKLKNKSPKIYLFTIEKEPQKFLAEIVKVSEGEIANVQYLRTLEDPFQAGSSRGSAKSTKSKSSRRSKKNADPEELDESDDEDDSSEEEVVPAKSRK